MKKEIFLKAVITIGLLAAGGALGVWGIISKGGEPVLCAMDVKICSNGSYVARTGPKCEFALCPKENLITVETPQAYEKIKSPLTIRGLARGNWYFEATFPIELLDGEGNVVAAHYAQAKSDWMTTDFVPFEAVIEFENPSTENGFLALKKDNPSGLSENDDELRIPVIFSP